MKTLYLKTTMKLLRLLPVLIFFMLALSYNARSQTVVKTPLCYGEPIQLLCNYTAGCDNQFATFHWENFSGSWTSSERDPVINVGEVGYATDKFYLSIQFAPPPGGFFGGRVTVTVLAPIIITGITSPVICFGSSTGSIDISVSGGQIPYTYLWSNGATTQDLTNLSDGTYQVTVTDGKSCTQASSVFVVTESSTLLTVTGTPTAATCNGGSNGSIDITPGGGNSPFTYLWSTSATTEDVSGLAAGMYTVTVTDSHNCTTTDSWYVGQPLYPLAVNGEPSNVLCFGGNSGSITVFSSGGTAPYTYLWSNGETGSSISGLFAGCYTVTVTDANLCTASTSICVTEPAALAVSGQATDVLCFNDCNGSIAITATGGTSPYTYFWSNGATTEDPTGLCAGTYAVTITDDNACTLVGNWTVGAPQVLSVTGTPVDALCNLSCDGAINITPAGGTAPYTYSWSNSATTQNVTGLCKGPYSVLITDAHNCTTLGTWTVGAPAELGVTGLASAASCYSVCDGSIDITPNGGTSPYTYAWSDPAASTSQNVTGLCAGDFFVTVTDAQNCTVVGTFTVTQPGEVSWQGSTTNVTCFGACNGTITTEFTLGGTPPYTYHWSNGATTADLTGLCAGLYELTVTDAHSCDARAFRTITQPELLVVDPVAVITPALCYNGSGGAIDITVTGGTVVYSYLWSNSATTEDIMDLAAGCYTVTVTDANQCSATGSFCVGQPAPVNAIGQVIDASCKGDCNGMIAITSVGGGTAPYGFLWSNAETTQNISGLCEGTYTVTVTDSHQCTFEGSWTVGAPEALAVTGVGSSASCFGECDGSINITPNGGTSPYTYVWSDPAGSTSQDISGLCPGDYTVTITDAHNCTISDSWTVTEPGEVSWQGSTTNVTCFGACNGTITTEFTLGGTPPYTYHWSNGATTADLTGLCAGTYNLTVTDSHSCDARSFRTITQPDLLVIDPVAVITPAVCYGGSGGSIEITVTGGTLPYSFIWSNNATTQNISGLTAGCYTVTVTDANNCTDTESFCVGQPDPVTATGTVVNALCKDDCNGTITLSGIAGGTAPYGFLWSNGETTQNISGLCEGAYTVTILDAHECSFTGSWTVGAPNVLDVTGVPSNTMCYGDCNGMIDITPVGGTAPYTYVWSDPAGSTSQNVDGLCAGDYFVTVTDAHNCTVVGSWTVGQPGEVSWQGSTTNVTCFGACNGTVTTEFTIGGTPPYTYLWSNGATTADLTGLCAGLYVLTVTDSHSCDARSFRTITEPAVLAVSPTAVIVPALCYNGTGGSIDITVSGGTAPYGFVWSNSATTEDIFDLSAGCYTVTVTDVNACATTASFCVGQPDPIAAIGQVTDALCKGDCNGLITLTSVTGGTAPYNYAWSNAETTQNISGLCEGTYTVTITDAHSCDLVGSWTVGAPQTLTVEGAATNSLCFGDCNGMIDIIPLGGTSPYTYVWSDPAASTSQDVNGLCAGDYFVTVTDAHNCTVVGSWTVGQPGEVSWQGSTTNVTCNGACNGTITTEFTLGGTPPYTYHWSNGATTADLTGLCAGLYELTVTDAHSCDARSFRTITQPDVLVINPVGVITPALCYGGSGGSIEITVTGGTLPYSFLWSNNATTQNISGLEAGCYTVTVTDANDCSDTETFCVGQPDAIAAIGVVTDVSCKGDCNGLITLTSVTGGTPPYAFAWSNFATTQNASGLCEGTYTVTITDSHSCEFVGSWTVGAPEVLTVTGVPTNSLCFGDCNGMIDITPLGGTSPYTYVWSDPAASTSQDVTGLCAGDYFVTVTDAHNCTVVESWTVGQPGEVSWQGSTTNVTCFGACNGTITTEFTMGGTPPYTYHWSNGATTADLTGLCAGLYELTVTDSHSCDARSFRTITEPAVLAVDPNAGITNVSCYGFQNGAIDITVTGGTEPYGYLWSNNATTQDISGLIAGCYTVTVTDYQNCMTTASFCISQPNLLTVVGSSTDALCKGDCNGTISLTVDGGTQPYAFAWSNGATTEDLTGLCEGMYSVTVTDAQSCDNFATFTIHAPDELVIGQPVVTDVTCYGASNGSINGGTITGVPPVILPIPVTGGTLPYTYLWSNGLTTDNLCCLVAGCYTVTVTDAHGCTDISSWCITQPPALTLEGALTSIACYSAATGAIDLTVTGGTPPIQNYTWSNGATTEDISGLTAGIYSVTVEDFNGCLATNSWEILQPTQLVVTLVDITNVSCFGLADGAINITVTGGTTPYSFAWSNSETTQNISGLEAGCYTVTVTDANGCTTTGSWCVTQPDALALEGAITSVDCYSFSTGAIDLTVTGGTMPYVYAWSNGASTEDLSGLLAGIYTVTVTDAHSCSITDSYEVLEPPMWSVGVTGPTSACCNAPGVDDYYANVFGVPTNCAIEYEWVVVGGTITSGWNTAHITVDWACCTQGTVTVTATKCDGCYLSSTLDVTVSLPPAPVVTGPATVYSNGTDTYCALPYIPGHLYSWSVVNGSYTTIPGTNCITVTWDSYPACGCAKVIVCETDPITGCTGCDTLYITMLPNPSDISIQGTVSYKNGLPNTPLNGVTIKLRNLTSGLIVGTTVSGPNMNPPLYTGDPGYYAFTNVPAGNYRLESSFNGTWGGNNATDALLVQLQAGLEFGNPSLWILQGLYHTVGDVNASGFVTALDALYIKLRTVGSINSYPAGDWAFEQPTVSTLPAVVDFAGLCEGDVNGSYIPTGFKEASFLSVVDDETQIVPVDQTFAYEIRSNMVAKLGAMTLFMGYDANRFEVMDVTSSSNDEMKYVIEDGNVAIAWADTKPMSVRNNDQIFTLNVKSKAPITEATQIFNVKAGSEFASPAGTRYDNFDLKMSKVMTVGGSNEFSIFNYPNPFATSTKIVYALPEAGKVTLVITDMFGKTVRTLVDENQAAGTYTIPVNAIELNMASGIYLYRIEAAGATNTYVKVNKMIFAR
jgi:uncharacterized protein (UPF0333 family)